MLDARYWIFRISQIVKSKNIQNPDARIEYQLTLARVFVVTTRMKCNILCNFKVNGGQMKVFNIRDFYEEEYKEFIIGYKALHCRSAYLVYGEVAPGDVRTMSPNGHDEILFLLTGKAVLEGKGEKTDLQKEEAVYMGPEDVFTFTALTPCRYVVAGGHPTAHDH
jgi:mannose-6-phosphate isomerase-like protein (cupin superfamily)